MGQLEQSDLEDATLEIDEALDIRRTPELFFGEQRVFHDDRPSKEGESSVLFENKSKSAIFVTIGILCFLFQLVSGDDICSFKSKIGECYAVL